MKQLLIKRILPRLVWIVLHIWCGTLRVFNKSPENSAFFEKLQGRYIMTHWHSRIFFLLYYFRGRRKWNILVSPSQDAEILARVGALLGYKVVRGSSYKNTLASSRQLIRALKRDEQIVIVADGSRGPRHIAQSGSIQLARITGAPVIAMTYGAQSKKELSSWDRFVLPLPFTRCTLNFSPPVTVPGDADPAMIEQKRVELNRNLNAITAEVE